MLDRPQETKNEKESLATNLIDALNDETQYSMLDNDLATSKMDTTSQILPTFLLEDPDAEGIDVNAMHLIPEGVNTLIDANQQVRINEPELKTPIDFTQNRALMKDVDAFPPVKNADGSTTYTVVMTGLTDRPAGRTDGVEYFRRNVEINVPAGSPSLNDCTFDFNSREMISKEEYDKLIDKAKGSNSEMELFAHGVSTDEMSADRQALMLQLSNGRPTVVLDWAAGVSSMDPRQALEGYINDTKAAKRANENKAFEGAIDDTIAKIGAENTSLIGFSHGGYFDTRYLNHRVRANLPMLDTVILTHPDVPIGAPELRVDGKADLLKRAAENSFVIGSRMDLALKSAVVASHLSPDSPVGQEGMNALRLGNNWLVTQMLIKKEGATTIDENNRPEKKNTQHFMNFAGIKTLLDSTNNKGLFGFGRGDEIQKLYDRSTDIGRMKIMPNGIWDDTQLAEKQLAGVR